MVAVRKGLRRPPITYGAHACRFAGESVALAEGLRCRRGESVRIFFVAIIRTIIIIISNSFLTIFSPPTPLSLSLILYLFFLRVHTTINAFPSRPSTGHVKKIK